MLRNPVYKGQPLMLQQQVVRHPITRKMSLKRRPVDECIPISANVAPALVSADKWQLANDQIDAGKTGARRNNQEPELWLLRAGYIVCGYCGKALSTGKTKGQPVYVCKHGIGSPCTSNASIYARDLDGAVWNMVKSVLQNPDWIRQSIKEQGDAASFAARIAEQQASLRRLRQEESRLAARLGALDDATPVIARLNEVSSRRKSVEAEIDGLVFQQRNVAQVARRMHGLDARFLAAFERVETMEYDEKRAILRQFGVNVKLWHRDHEPRYAIDWQFDLGDDWFCPQDDDDAWVIYSWESATPDFVATTD